MMNEEINRNDLMMKGFIVCDCAEKGSVNGNDIFLLEPQDAAWLASYEWNIRARFITS